MSKKIDILGVNFDSLTIDEANNKIIGLIKSNAKSAYVVKPYSEFLVRAANNQQISKQLNDAYLVLADGVSVQWAASYLYGEPKRKLFKLIRSLVFWLQNMKWRSQILPEKMAGLNQTLKLLDLADKNNLTVGIIGGEQSPDDIKNNILSKYPNLTNLHCWSGYYKPNQEDKIISQMKEAQLDLLFVAMGFPKQEDFIARNLSKNIAKVAIGEGGSFNYDQIGGSIKRAPKNVQNLGLEWLWRLMIQPKRIIRQLSIIKYIYLVYRQSKTLR